MAFPFFPAGAITASLLLGGTIVLFRALLLALDRGAAELRGSIGPGLVRGVRAWVDRPGLPDAARSASPRPPRYQPRARDAAHGWSMPTGVVLEDVTTPPGVETETVRPRG